MPAPLGPRRTTASPRSIARSTRTSAGAAPNSLVTPRRSTAASFRPMGERGEGAHRVPFVSPGRGDGAAGSDRRVPTRASASEPASRLRLPWAPAWRGPVMRRAFALFGLSATFAVAWISIASLASPRVGHRPMHGIDATAWTLRTDTAHRGARFPCSRARRSRSRGRRSRGSPMLSYTVDIAGGGVQVGTVTISAERPELVRDHRPRVDLQCDGGSVRGDGRGADDRSGLQRGRVRLHRGTEPLHDGRRCRRDGDRGRWGIPACALPHAGSWARRGEVFAAGVRRGATAGLGGAVLLQQFCTLPLTPASAAGSRWSSGRPAPSARSLRAALGRAGARRVARLGAGHGGEAPGGEPTDVIRGSGGGGGDVSGGPSPAPTAPIPPAPPPPSGGVIVPPVPSPKTDRAHVLELWDREFVRQPVLHELRDQAGLVSSDPRIGIQIGDYQIEASHRPVRGVGRLPVEDIPGVGRSIRASALASIPRGVAQPGSAPALGAGGRRFESARPDAYAWNRHACAMF